MNEVLDLGCDLFIDASLEQDILASDLAKILNSFPDEWGNIEVSEGDISIAKNDEFDEELRKKLKGFLYYRFLLEIEPNIELGKENAVRFVSKILEHLWSQGYPATAACDYEDELPYKGKFIPTNHLWN